MQYWFWKLLWPFAGILDSLVNILTGLYYYPDFRLYVSKKVCEHWANKNIPTSQHDPMEDIIVDE